MDPLGKPVTDVGDDHGAGIGVGGGGTAAPNTQNSQAAKMAAESQSGFNAGVGGAHASGGLPTGHTSTGSTGSATSNTPIADKFMSGGAGAGAAAGVGSGLGSGQDAVSGAYEGGGARDALTGQSRATETGAGVGYMGENLPSSTERTDGGLSGAGLAGAGAGAGAGLAGVGAGEGLAHSSRTEAPLTKGAQLGTAGTGGSDAVGTGHAYGTGVGAEGGAGGHYGSTGTGTSGTGAGAGAAAGAGAGAAGAGSGDNSTGHYGTQEKDFDRGAPVSNPKELDSGGPHSLIFDKETGKYIHRHEVKGGALADDARPTTTQE